MVETTDMQDEAGLCRRARRGDAGAQEALYRRHAPRVFTIEIDPDKIGSTLRDKPIIDYDELRAMMGPGTVVLAAVGSRGARALIREQLTNIGLREGWNFWCVA